MTAYLPLRYLGEIERTDHYYRTRACSTCGRFDSDGTRGPDAPVSPHPVDIDVCIENHADRWYCAEHSAEVWAAHLRHLQRLANRLERIERWKLGLLEWQTPRVWVQLDLFDQEEPR